MSELREVYSYDGLTGESRRMSWGRSSWPPPPAVANLLERLGQARRALGERVGDRVGDRILNRILTKFADYGQQACICKDCPMCEGTCSCVKGKQD